MRQECLHCSQEHSDIAGCCQKQDLLPPSLWLRQKGPGLWRAEPSHSFLAAALPAPDRLVEGRWLPQFVFAPGKNEGKIVTVKHSTPFYLQFPNHCSCSFTSRVYREQIISHERETFPKPIFYRWFYKTLKIVFQ